MAQQQGDRTHLQGNRTQQQGDRKNSGLQIVPSVPSSPMQQGDRTHLQGNRTQQQGDRKNSGLQIVPSVPSSPMHDDLTKIGLIAPCEHPYSFTSWLRMCYPHGSIEDVRNPVFWRDVGVETLVNAYVGCCVVWVLVTLNPTSYAPSTTHFGLFVSFFIFLLIEGYGPMSGAPMNPTVCWGFFLSGRMSAARLFFYTLGETGGIIIGAWIGYSLQPHNDVTVLLAIKPHPTMVPGNAMLLEAILTFNLVFVALSVTNPRGKTAILPSLPIALCVGTGSFIAGTHTGGLQNPLVPLGPAVITKDFENHWVYWVGPYLGSTAGAIVYQLCQFIKDHFEHHCGKPLSVGHHNPAIDVEPPANQEQCSS